MEFSGTSSSLPSVIKWYLDLVWSALDLLAVQLAKAIAAQDERQINQLSQSNFDAKSDAKLRRLSPEQVRQVMVGAPLAFHLYTKKDAGIT